MSLTDEYYKHRKKRKNEEENQQNNGLLYSSHFPDLAPVAISDDEDEDIAPVASQEERTWFQKGAFEDGYQFGDLSKTIGETGADLRAGLLSGVLGIGERALDAIVQVGTMGALGATGGFVSDTLGESDKLKAWAQDFVAKDLYDERAIAEKIVKYTTATGWANIGEDPTDDSVLGAKSDSLAESGGQLLATAGLQAVGVPWWLTTGATSFGGELENAYAQDATFEEATGSAAISAGAEILTEKLFGGIKFGGKTLDDVLVKPFVDKISSKTVRTLVNLGIDTAGEGAEEVLSQVFSNLGSALYKEESLDEILWSEEALDGYLESFIGGAVLGGISSGGKTLKAVGEGVDVTTGLSKNETKVFEKELEDRIKEAEEDGKKLTSKEKSAIYDAVMNDLQKGYISTEKIESILGGETYKTYQDTIANEDALKQEFDTLNKMKQGEMTGEQIDRRAELKQQLEEIKNNATREQLQKQLSDETLKLLQGDRKGKGSLLFESYNENARKGQAFQADTSKYDAKQAEIVQKAVDSGVLNNTNRSHELVDMIAKIAAEKGVGFDFTNNAKLKESGFAVDGKQVNGYVTKDGITLNINSQKLLNSVVGHEISHVMEGTEIYTEMQNALMDYAKAKGDYQGRYDALTKLYEGVEGANVDAELTADLVGDYLFTDPDFVSHLSTKHRNIFQKIYDEIKYLWKSATAGSKEARELEKVKRTFEKAYRESGKAQSDADAKTDTKYSLSDSDGKQLTKEQSEYFKDSKMRDENGNLKVMYHGSQDAGFHVFDPAHSDDEISLFFVDRNDVAASYSGTTETYEAKAFHSVADANKFFVEIGKSEYEVIEKDGEYTLLDDGDEVATSADLAKIYEEFCDYEGVGYGDANYKVYLNLTNPLEVDAKGRPWNKIDAEFSQEVYDRYKGLTAEEKVALTDLAEWEDFRLFNSEIQEAVGNELASAYAKMGEDVNIYDLFSVAADNFSEESMRENARYYLKTRDFAQRAKEQGYDGVIFKNIHDNGGYSNGDEGASTVAIAFNPNQIKSVANGKPTADADIRYSLSDSESVEVTDSGTVTKYSLATWTADTQAKVRENLIKVGYEPNKVDKWIKDTNSVAAVIAADKGRLDFEAADNQTMLKDNQEYIKTLDASTLCAKRLVYQGTFDAIQHRLPNTMLSSDDLIDLLNTMKKHGVQTPCGVCYVESRRRHLGKFAQDWLNGYNGEYKPRLDEVTTSDGLEMLRKSHPQTYQDFVDAMNKKGSSNPKVVQLRTEYRNDIMSLTPAQVRKIEAIGGLRVQSFSDFETPHMLDMMQAVMDMSAKGLHSQAYTKVPNFAWVFGDTGIKINLSLIAEGDGFDADGNLVFSSTEGMDIDEAMKLRDAYSANVGTIIVGANDKHILACMADDRIDFIIPFHRSGWGMKELEMMGMDSYTDYTYGQKEHDLATGKGVENLYPPDYWDYTLSGKENAERYLNLCAKTGREPKFSKFLVNNGDGSYSLQPDGSTDGYWKTLIDFKMYDNEGNGAVQQKVQPNFNMNEAYRVLGEYHGGANTLPVANDVVEEFVAKYQYAEELAPAMSLSELGEKIKYYGNLRISGKDVAYAPVAEDVQKVPENVEAPIPETEAVQDVLPEDFAPTYDSTARGTLEGQQTMFEEEAQELSRLDKKLARIDARLKQDEATLMQEFQQRKAELQQAIADKNAYISKKADDLYWELSALKKGVRASKELGYLLDYGYKWSEIKTALVNTKLHPEARVNQDSVMESVVRDFLNKDYEDRVYEVDDMDTEYQAQVEELRAEADKARKEARKAEGRLKRSELHSNIMDNLKAEYAKQGYDLDKVLKNAKDLSTIATVDNTPQRVMEKALGYKEGKILADFTVNKVAQNETEGIKWLNGITDRKSSLLAKLSKQYNIKPGSKESAAAQMYGEGFYVNENGDRITYGDAELAKDFPDANVQRNIKGLANDPRVRQFYDETLAAINESRARNAYPEIPRLDNYYLHFRAMEDTFSRLGLPFNPNDIRAKDLPTDLNGMTADLKPGQPYFASAMHRRGQKTSYDLLGGLERYATSAKNQIYHIDDIQNLRALRNYIADTYGQANGLDGLDELSDAEAQARIEQVFNSHLSTFAKFLNEEANVLAGKTALIDRGLEGIIGRRGITFLNTINGQVGSNMVGMNVSSSLTNFLPVVQTFAKTNKADFVKGFAQTVSNRIKSIGGSGDSFAEDSPVMIRRKGADRFYRTPFQKVGDAGYVLMSAVDSISTELIARTKFNEFTRKGMDAQQAHIETDKWVSRLMGDRSLGQMPQLYNSKTLGLITKFQLEVRNQLDSQFYDTIQEAKVSSEDIGNAQARNAKTAAKVASTFVQLAIAQHLFGKAFEAVAGYNPAFDIVEVLIKTLGLDDDEDDEDTVLDNVEEGFLTLLEDLPYTSTFTGGRIPISSALPIKELVTGVDEYGNDKSRLETLGEVAPYYLLPTGYGQIKKTYQGLSMFDDDLPVSGSYTDSGNLRFPVEDTPLKRVQAGLFGQWASANARDYFDNERSPLKEKQIQEFVDVDIPIQEYWDYREGLADQKTLEEKFDYIAGLDLPVEKKNILINNIVDRKEEVDMSNYDDFATYEEFDFATKNEEKYAFLEANGISYSDYNASEDSREAYNWAFNNPEKFLMTKAVTEADVVAYRKYASGLYAIKADKDKDGDSIRGSRKEKVADYINGLDLDYGAKAILFKNEYPSEDTYNMDIIDYLNGREDISYKDMATILRELGFTVHDDGRITWD